MSNRLAPALTVASILFSTAALSGDMPSTPRIVSPEAGATVSSPVTVRFEGNPSSGATAAMPGPMMGASSKSAMSGMHLHMFVDAAAPKAGQVVPVDNHHLHFMGGETQTSLRLPPGRHTLQLVVGGANHVVSNPLIVSQPVTITVK
jgi:hypothetical protein